MSFGESFPLLMLIEPKHHFNILLVQNWHKIILINAIDHLCLQQLLQMPPKPSLFVRSVAKNQSLRTSQA